MLVVLLSIVFAVCLSHSTSSTSSSSTSSSSSSSSTSSTSTSDKTDGKDLMKKRLPVYLTFGSNNYYGDIIANYTKDVDWGFMNNPGIYEVYGHIPNADNGEPITLSTDDTKILATTDSFILFGGFPPNLIDRTKINVPLCEIGTYFVGSRSLWDRTIIQDFEDGMRRGDIFGAEKYHQCPTVYDWAQANGELMVEEMESGEYMLTLEMCGLRNSIYTVWETGVNNVRTYDSEGKSTEMPYGVPAGGIPNYILTNGRGYGKKMWIQKHNPLEKCMPGKDCTTNYSAAYHWDGSAYGGAPSLIGTAGLVVANHLWIPTNGEIQVPPTRWAGPTCR